MFPVNAVETDEGGTTYAVPGIVRSDFRVNNLHPDNFGATEIAVVY
jgi:hypothetical protein